MTTEILSAEQFTNFLRSLDILKEVCNDIDMRGGIIRQKTNMKDCYFEIDLTEFLSLNLPITRIKEKLDLFKSFMNNQEIQIEETADDSGNPAFSIADQYSRLAFKSIILNYLDNTFVSDEDMSATWNFDESDLILSVDIPKIISDRMKVVSKVFNVVTTQVVFNGEHALIKSQTANTEQEAMFMKDIITNDNTLESYLNLSIVPFTIDHDGEINFQVYKRTNASGQEIALNKFETNIAGDIKIKVYSASVIKTLD